MVLENSNMHTAILTVTAGRVHVAKWMRYNPYGSHPNISLAEPVARPWLFLYLAYQNLFLQHELCRNTAWLQLEDCHPR